MDIGPTGFTIDIAPDGSHLRQAADIEELGYTALWVSGGQIDRLDRLAELVRATGTATVVPGIVMPDRHPADALAALVADLERTHPGRFLTGLGAPQRPRAMAALDDYVDRIDAVAPRDRRILAALGPRKLEMARDRFGGATTVLTGPQHTASARATLGADRLLAVTQLVSLDEDPQRARDAARPTLSFLLGVRGYPENIRRMGLSDNDIETLSDQLVDAVLAHGGVDAIAERIAAHRAAGADHVDVSVLASDGGPTGVTAARELAGALLGHRRN